MTDHISIDEPLLSVSEVAKIFGVRPLTVRTWITEGRIKATKINTHWRIPKSEATRFANEKYGSK